jgi:hypothetical protein
MWMRFVWLAVIAVLVCSSASAQNGGKPKPSPGDKGAPPALDLTGGMSGIRQSRQVVVTSTEEWKNLWQQHAGTSRAPEVDFARWDIIAVFAGAKPTGGYQVHIDGVRLVPKKKEVVVSVTLLKPRPGAITIQAFTFPFAMKAVPKLPPVLHLHWEIHEAYSK